jgi:hypothetical protein
MFVSDHTLKKSENFGVNKIEIEVFDQIRLGTRCSA